MFCSHCGKEVPKGDRFCQHCGAPCQPMVKEAPLPASGTGGGAEVLHHGPRLLGRIIVTAAKAALLYFILRASAAFFDTYIVQTDLLGFTIFYSDGEEFTAFLAIISAAEVFLSMLVQKFPTRLVDQIFLLIPWIPALRFLLAVVLNLSAYFRALGIAWAILSISAVVIGLSYCASALFSSDTAHSTAEGPKAPTKEE